MNFKRPFCKECTFDGHCEKVQGRSLNDQPRIAIFMAAPSADDITNNGIFENGMGRFFKAIMHNAGLNPQGFWLSYLHSCVLDPAEQEAGRGACASGLDAELAFLAAGGCHTIVAVGDAAARRFGVLANIIKARGSVYEYGAGTNKFFVIPTYAPDYVMKGNRAEEVVMISDLKKAIRIADDSWAAPQELFNIEPTIEELEAITEKLCASQALLAADLETTSLNPMAARIIVCGFAIDKNTAFSIPLLQQGGVNAWPTIGEQQRAYKCIENILKNCTIIFQNAAYDYSVLTYNGFKFGRRPHDTMLMHHAFHPELKHNLGFLGSLYADTPYWKDSVLGSETDMINLPNNVLRTYNLRDCVVLFPIMEQLQLAMQSNGTNFIYENVSRKMVRPVTMMELNGMRLLPPCQITVTDKDRGKQDETNLIVYKDWATAVTSEVEVASNNFRTMFSLPSSFNMGGASHVKWLFFGERPKTLAEKIEQYESYDAEKTRKKKTTKAYKELESLLETFATVAPLLELKGNYETTDTGGKATSNKALTKMKIMAINEIENQRLYKRPRPEHAVRAEALRVVIHAIEVFLQWRKWQKLSSTYTVFRTGGDGRIHPKYNIAGTRTGRLSSSGPNWQNLPPIVKQLFGPAPGNVMIQADYSNIEMRVLAHESNDEVLQEQFSKGIKVHDANTQVLFGADRAHPDFDKLKKAAKTYIFGRGYGGGLRGIYERVYLQVPELKLSFETFVRADEAYRKAHPAYAAWVERTQANAIELKFQKTAFGRVRQFLDTDDKIKRECLNTPCQSVAADIFNSALVSVQKWIDSNKTTAKLIGAVHDSIILECNASEMQTVGLVLKTIMEQEHQLWGKTVSFPVEIEYSAVSWADTEPLILEEQQHGNTGSIPSTKDDEDRDYVWASQWGAEDDGESESQRPGR